MSDGAPVRVLLVDDHAMVRQALGAVLGAAPDLALIGAAGSRREGLALARAERPDVIVLDYNLPDGGAIDLLADLERHDLHPQVLVLTVHESVHYAVRVLEAGAQGFLVKSSAVDELLTAIRRVHAGELYVTPPLSRAVLDELRRPRADRTGLSALSVREFELLRELGRGLGIKEAAHKLKISVSTASTYRARLLDKLGLASTTELIRFALDNDLVG